MKKRNQIITRVRSRPVPLKVSAGMPLWQMDIGEIAGHNIEAKGREVVNRMLKNGWVLLHIYTLKYRVNGDWAQKPMAILGRPKNVKFVVDHNE